MSTVNDRFLLVAVARLGSLIEALCGAVAVLGVAHVDSPGDSVTRGPARCSRLRRSLLGTSVQSVPHPLAGPPPIQPDRVDGAAGLDEEIDGVGKRLVRVFSTPDPFVDVLVQPDVLRSHAYTSYTNWIVRLGEWCLRSRTTKRRRVRARRSGR